MIEEFNKIGVGSSSSLVLTCSINQIGSCITKLGGVANNFDPLDYVSGLEDLDSDYNVKQVITTTKKCYKLGKIIEASNDGNEITIVFSGNSGNKKYISKGIISSKIWRGNEAIDYIYTPGEGKMSVKAYENGKWIDRSSDSQYNIYWELEESEPEGLSESAIEDKKLLEQNINIENKNINAKNGISKVKKSNNMNNDNDDFEIIDVNLDNKKNIDKGF